jgi:hypothetical protein
MTTPSDHFDDPALRSAVKRLYEGGSAPEALRQRVQELLCSQPTSSSLPPSLPPPKKTYRISDWRWPTLALAAAAVFIVGFAGLYVHNHRQPGKTGPVGAAGAAGGESRIDHEILVALVKTHDQCSCLSDYELRDLPKKDVKAIARAMGRKLHDRILAANLVEDGWQLRNAAICKVGDRPAAHIFYVRGGQTMSVFSVPNAPKGTCFDCGIDRELVDNHVLAGFASKGRIYCMVGYCPKNDLKLEEVASLLERHRGEVVDQAGEDGHAVRMEGSEFGEKGSGGMGYR